MAAPHRLVEGTATVDDVDAFVTELGAVGDAHGCTVQAFDARYVVDAAHLRRALELADRAIERGENVARDRAVEVLLYAAGRRQIDRALAMGVSEGRQSAVVLVAADPTADAATTGETASGGDERAPSERVDAAAADVADLLDSGETLGEYDPELVAEFFDVTDAERAATDAGLPELVRERVALLDVEK
jgi:KEOPS complex subunit Cgi121